MRFPARSAVGVRRVGASATPRRFATRSTNPGSRVRIESGVAAFRRPCHRSPKALRAGDRLSGSPRGAPWSAEGRSVSDAHSAVRRGLASPAVGSGFESGVAPFRRACRRSPKALRAGDRLSGSPRGAPWSAEGRSFSDAHSALRRGPASPAVRSGFESGVAPFRRACHRSPKALRAEDRSRRFPARSAFGVRREGAQRRHAAVRRGPASPTVGSGFESGVAPFRRACHRSPKALRAAATSGCAAGGRPRLCL